VLTLCFAGAKNGSEMARKAFESMCVVLTEHESGQTKDLSPECDAVASLLATALHNLFV